MQEITVIAQLYHCEQFSTINSLAISLCEMFSEEEMEYTIHSGFIDDINLVDTPSHPSLTVCSHGFESSDNKLMTVSHLNKLVLDYEIQLKNEHESKVQQAVLLRKAAELLVKTERERLALETDLRALAARTLTDTAVFRASLLEVASVRGM